MKRSKALLSLTFTVFGTSSFGMMRMLSKKPPVSSQQTRAFTTSAKTTALTTVTKSSPSFFNRLQQKLTELKARGLNAWTNFKNRFSKAPAITSQSIAEKQPLAVAITPPQKSVPIGQPEISMIAQLQMAQSLPEMEQILQRNEAQEHNKQKDLLNIPNEKWLALLKKEQEDFIWIKNNCFKNKNVTTDDRAKIPLKTYDRIINCFKAVDKNPLSVKFIWEKITTPDIFGHKAIITNGPIVNDSITGLEQIPTITFDPDKVSALSPEEFDFELYHAITHLIQGDHDKLHLLKNAVGEKRFNQYTQSSEGKEYIALLETNADIELSLHSPDVATTGFNSFLVKTLNSFLSTMSPIKSTMTEQEILAEIQTSIGKSKYENIHEETITCPLPDPEFLFFIQQLNSLEDVEKFSQNKRKEIIKAIGLSDDQLQEYHKLLNNSIEYWNKHFKQINKGRHSPDMPPHLMKLIKTLLRQSRIEPSSMDIDITLDAGGSVSNFSAPFFLLPKFSLSPSLNAIDATAVILHEIGHILKHHLPEKLVLAHYCSSLGIDLETIKKSMLELAKLQELEADIFLATAHPDAAKLMYISAKQQIGWVSSSAGKKTSSLHPTTADRVHIYQKILSLHAQKKTMQQKGFFTTIDQTKE